MNPRNLLVTIVLVLFAVWLLVQLGVISVH